MTPKIKNPFIITGYISPEYFCDREKETEKIIANIENGRNTALISDRRMGKTGLIEHVYHQRQIEKDYYTFLIDIYSTGSLKEFVFLLGKHIFETLKPRGQRFIDKFFATITSLRPALKFDSVTSAPEFNIGIGEIRQPEVSLEQIFQYLESADKRCIVAIDEFQQIAKYPENNIEALLRTHIQRSKNANFIFAGSIHHMMQDIFFTASRPFYQSVSLLKLGPIEEEKYAGFVMNFFNKAGVEIPLIDIYNVYDLLEGHTWYMQAVFNEIYAQTSKGNRIGLETINFAMRNVVMTYEPIYQNILSNLTERQKEVLFAIAKEDEATEITSADFIRRHSLQSTSSVQSSAKQLIAKEIVMKQSNRYFIPDRFFAIWLKMTYGSGFSL
ncbi:ATPase [Odoribacter sp. OttesenSCG-928-G04]|nr:ATPase [Odoribacter sp. OttesenSCG-928-G04]